MSRKLRLRLSFVICFVLMQTAFVRCSPTNQNSESPVIPPPQSKVRPPNASPHSTDDDLYVARRLLVKGRIGVLESELEAELGKHGGKTVGKIDKINVHIVELPENANEKAIAALLAHNPKFEFAEVDRMELENLIPSDPYYGNAWHLRNIGAPAAWDSSQGNGVIIAILDSGADPTHPDLAAKLVEGWNIYDNNSDWSDKRSHGTNVAGTAAAITNNAVGVSGIAMNSKIMPIRISSLDGYATYSTAASGLTWAADHGAKVANLSFQIPCSSATAQSAANYFRSKGGVVTGAAGNYAKDEGFAPSGLVTCVSATDSSNMLTTWSSFGAYVDVAAPGSGIYTTFPGGTYGSVSGTSFSAPLTAGVYALIIAANPNLSPSQLDQVLFSTALDLGAVGFDSQFGNGRIDASRAVAAAKALATQFDTTLPSVAIASPLSSAVISGVTAIDVTASDNVGVTKVQLYVNGILYATDSSAPYSFAYDSTARPDGPMTLQARASDAAGNISATSEIGVRVDNIPEPVADTVAPLTQILNPLNGASIAGARWTVNISATASDNVAVSSMKLIVDGSLKASSSSGSVSYAWNVKRVSFGLHTIRIEARDLAGNIGTTTIQVRK